MLHYEQVFGNVFERRKSNSRAVLMKYCRKVKGEQVIILLRYTNAHKILQYIRLHIKKYRVDCVS